MLINTAMQYNIGKILGFNGGFSAFPVQQSIVQKWNSRGRFFSTNDSGFPGTHDTNDAKYLLRINHLPFIDESYTNDTNRVWASTKTQIVIRFNDAMADAALSAGNPATGHTINVDGSPQTTNYESGSGTDTWVLSIPVVLTRQSVITYSYSQAAGATLSVLNSTELSELSGVAVTNFLTKRIRFTLKNAAGSLVTSETVKLAVFTYNSGTVDDDVSTATNLWMARHMKTLATTDGSGVLDVQYLGTESATDTMYVAVIRPNTSPTQSFIWNDTIA
jgi:hypothetical protein